MNDQFRKIYLMKSGYGFMAASQILTKQLTFLLLIQYANVNNADN